MCPANTFKAVRGPGMSDVSIWLRLQAGERGLMDCAPEGDQRPSRWDDADAQEHRGAGSASRAQMASAHDHRPSGTRTRARLFDTRASFGDLGTRSGHHGRHLFKRRSPNSTARAPSRPTRDTPTASAVRDEYTAWRQAVSRPPGERIEWGTGVCPDEEKRAPGSLDLAPRQVQAYPSNLPTGSQRLPDSRLQCRV